MELSILNITELVIVVVSSILLCWARLEIDETKPRYMHVLFWCAFVAMELIFASRLVYWANYYDSIGA